MEKKIRKLYLIDFSTVMVFLSLFWMLILFVALNVIALALSTVIRNLILITTALIIIFGTACSLAVIVHLKKNQTRIYTEEIMSYQNK